MVEVAVTVTVVSEEVPEIVLLPTGSDDVNPMELEILLLEVESEGSGVGEELR